MHRISLLSITYFRRKKYKLLLFACVFVPCVWTIWDFLGVSDYLKTKDFDKEFDYPLNIDIKPLIKEVLDGKEPSVPPINQYPYKYLTTSRKCNSLKKLDLFIVVKSAMANFGHRMAIRVTYGQEDLIRGKTVKVLFFLGVEQNYPNTQTQKYIEDEMDVYNDIIQMDFLDSYYNNTIKTMMQFRWFYENCPIADYYLFIDDDMYISTVNLLNYVQDEILAGKGPFKKRDNLVYAGYVFRSAPQRFRASKWRVSYEEYPWNKWPPYVTAGAYLVSNTSLKVLYAGSLFVKHFRFDDVYLGVVAKKAGIEPQHCPHFYFFKKMYDIFGYSTVIAAHGYSNHDLLLKVWNEQMRVQL